MEKFTQIYVSSALKVLRNILHSGVWGKSNYSFNLLPKVITETRLEEKKEVGKKSDFTS